MADQSYWQGGQPGGHGQFPLQMPPPPPVNQCQGGMPPLLVQPVAPVRKGRRPIGVLAMIVVAAWPGLVLWTGCFEGCWLLLVVLRPLACVLVG